MGRPDQVLRRARPTAPERRNPLLALPAVAELQALPPDVRARLRAVLIDLRHDARARAERSWRTHKPPMASYWASVSVYAGHLARLLR